MIKDTCRQHTEGKPMLLLRPEGLGMSIGEFLELSIDEQRTLLADKDMNDDQIDAVLPKSLEVWLT